MSVPSLIPLTGRARLVVALLAVTVVFDVVTIVFDAWEISTIDDFVDGTASTNALSASDSRQAAIALLVFIAFVLTAIVFIRWFHAAYRNLVALGASELRFTTGWAIGAWFVPLLCFWWPKQIADDIWRGSDPEAPPAQGLAFREGAVAAFVTLWWVFWLATSIGGNLAVRVLFSADTLDDYRNSARVDIGVSLLDIAAAVLAIGVVRRITARQLERESQLAAVEPAPSG